MRSILAKIKNYLLGNEEKEPYPLTDSPEEVYEFFQRMKPYEKLIENKIDWFSRSNSLYGRIKE